MCDSTPVVAVKTAQPPGFLLSAIPYYPLVIPNGADAGFSRTLHSAPAADQLLVARQNLVGGPYAHPQRLFRGRLHGPNFDQCWRHPMGVLPYVVPVVEVIARRGLVTRPLLQLVNDVMHKWAEGCHAIANCCARGGEVDDHGGAGHTGDTAGGAGVDSSTRQT